MPCTSEEPLSLGCRANASRAATKARRVRSALDMHVSLKYCVHTGGQQATLCGSPTPTPHPFQQLWLRAAQHCRLPRRGGHGCVACSLGHVDCTRHTERQQECDRLVATQGRSHLALALRTKWRSLHRYSANALVNQEATAG